MMRFFRSIQWKLTAAMVGLTLLLSLGEQFFFAVYDANTYPTLLQQRMNVLAKVVGGNATSALAFRNRDDAVEVLSSLRSEPSIRSAYLFDNEGKVLGEYVRAGELLSVPVVSSHRDESTFETDALVVFHRILLNDQEVGHMILTSDLHELAARRNERTAVGLKVGTSLVILSVVLAIAIQRVFTKPIRELVAVTDEVTARKNYSLRAERRTDDEFGILVDALNSMMGEIEKRDQELKKQLELLKRTNTELDQFVYAASHDLKAPLRAVDTLALLIDDETRGYLAPDKHELLDLMRSRIRRMENLIDDLLQYSRVGREGAVSEEVNTRELLEGLIELLAPPPAFTIDLPREMPTVVSPRAPLEQVFRNLIGNALKHHHRKDGRISIAADTAGDRVKFSVSDDGPGIAPRYHHRIFQMFQTLKSRDEVEGSGMGLALVKKIVENYKGSVTVLSAEGAGATFSFTWPKFWPGKD